MTGIDLALAALIVTVGSTVQRALGFGAALISVPVLLLIDPRLVPGPITIASAVVVVLMLVGTRGETDWRGVRWIVAGLVPGTVLAGVTLAVLPQRVLAAGAGLVVLVAVGAVVARHHLPRRRRSLLGTGAVSGFMATASGIGGPPLALLYHDATPAMLRATLARVFLIGSALTLLALAGADRLGTSEWAAGLAMAPGGPLGYAAGGHLARWLDGPRLRVGVLVLSSLAALIALADALL